MKTQSTVERELLTPMELAEFLRVSLKWVRAHSAKIAGYTKIGHIVRYRKSSVMIALQLGKILKN